MKSDLQKSDSVPVAGRVQIDVFDAETGEHLRHGATSNVVTTDGKAVLASLLRGTGTAVTHMATGSDDTAELVSDTALGSEAYRDQITAYSVDGGGEVTFRLFIGAASANGTVIKEAGLFNDSTAGDCIARVTFDPGDQVTKSSSITAQITWTIDIG